VVVESTKKMSASTIRSGLKTKFRNLSMTQVSGVCVDGMAFYLHNICDLS